VNFQLHDPEKACPALDAGWVPVFRRREAHAIENSPSGTLTKVASNHYIK
jgi:hypothetical protein